MAHQILGVTINCGEKTCAREPGKFCRFFGSRKFGQVPVCTLFPAKDGSRTYTDLEEEGGWTQRCEACTTAEM